jgi:hypothetical protein
MRDACRNGAQLAEFLKHRSPPSRFEPPDSSVVADAAKDAEAASPKLEAYAKERGLLYFEHWSMPEPTQLLQHGFTEDVPNLVMGDLPGGLEDAWLAHFDYKTIGSKVHDHLFTVVLARAPRSAAIADRVLCHDRDLSEIDTSNPASGLELLELDDRRVEVESDAFLSRYAIWTGHDQDEVRAWEMFDPALISWLTDEAPQDFSFELQNGALACFVPGVVADGGALDALCLAASRVLERVNAVSGDPKTSPAAETTDQGRDQRIEQELAEHPFERPPKSVFAAALHFGALRLLSSSSWQLASEAFFRAHAAAVGLKRIDPEVFLAQHVDTVIPGVVTQVAQGRLPGTDLDGYLIWSTDVDNRGVSWEIVLAPIRPEDNGYAFVHLPEAKQADDEGFELNSDGSSISVFKGTFDPRKRDAKQLKEFLGRACPLLAHAVAAARERNA